MESAAPTAPVTPSRRRRVLGILLATPLLLAVAYFGGIGFAPWFLAVEKNSTQPADVIVVLGGETGTRTAQAAKLFQEGRAPVILISGAGDTELYSTDLKRRGVPASALLTEDKSSTTAENAQFTIPLLRERGLTNVLLVTSWFHSRRALACFEHYGPDLHFAMSPAPRISPNWWPNRYERHRILNEYLKTAGYIFRHGVLPF